jgi:hypothetical protein
VVVLVTRQAEQIRSPRRYSRYVAYAGILIVVSLAISTLISHPRGARGIRPGARVPPFAVPLADSSLEGDANVATHANEGSAGRRAACTVRGPAILNICQLYERRPVVLALFLGQGSCWKVLDEMQALTPSFSSVRFAAVAIKGSRKALVRLVRSHRLTFPVGIDRDGILAPLYEMSTCPQINLVYPGGAVESPALLSRPSLATLRARVAQLARKTQARALSAR